MSVNHFWEVDVIEAEEKHLLSMDVYFVSKSL